MRQELGGDNPVSTQRARSGWGTTEQQLVIMKQRKGGERSIDISGLNLESRPTERRLRGDIPCTAPMTAAPGNICVHRMSVLPLLPRD